VIVHAALPDQLGDIKVRVNGAPLQLSWSSVEGGTELSGPVSAAVLRSGDGRARVEVELPTVLTPDRAGPGSIEARSLGVAIAELSIVPD
jgi:hypothetical protein